GNIRVHHHLAALVEQDPGSNVRTPQVAHHAVLTEEGVLLTVRRRAVARDLAPIVDALSKAHGATQSPELVDRPVDPYGGSVLPSRVLAIATGPARCVEL